MHDNQEGQQLKVWAWNRGIHNESHQMTIILWFRSSKFNEYILQIYCDDKSWKQCEITKYEGIGLTGKWNVWQLYTPKEIGQWKYAFFIIFKPPIEFGNHFYIFIHQREAFLTIHIYMRQFRYEILAHTNPRGGIHVPRIVRNPRICRLLDSSCVTKCSNRWETNAVQSNIS